MEGGEGGEGDGKRTEVLPMPGPVPLPVPSERDCHTLQVCANKHKTQNLRSHRHLVRITFVPSIRLKNHQLAIEAGHSQSASAF